MTDAPISSKTVMQQARDAFYERHERAPQNDEPEDTAWLDGYEAGLDVRRPADETSGELERLSLEFSLASQQAAQLRDDRDHLRIRHQEAFRIINAATYYVSQSRQLHGEMVAWLNGGSAQETSPEESNGIETDEECKCGSPLERHWYCRFCGIVPGPSPSVEPRETACRHESRVSDNGWTWCRDCGRCVVPKILNWRCTNCDAHNGYTESVCLTCDHPRPAVEPRETSPDVWKLSREAKLEFALRGLYWDQVDYLTLNKLGGMQNHWMRAAREALGMDIDDVRPAVEPSRNQTTNSSGESSLTATASGDTGGAGLLPAASSPDTDQNGGT